MLRDVTERARKHGATLSHAWVHKTGRIWRFIYGGFQWCGRAENAWHARAKGWEQWLKWRINEQ